MSTNQRKSHQNLRSSSVNSSDGLVNIKSSVSSASFKRKEIDPNNREKVVIDKHEVFERANGKLVEEIKHLKSYVVSLKQKLQKNCLVLNKNDTLQKLIAENIKLNSEVRIIENEYEFHKNKISKLKDDLKLIESNNRELRKINGTLKEIMQTFSVDE